MLRLLLIGWLLAVLPQQALAHAVLLETAPADGQRVDAAPDAVTLTFNEPVLPVSVRLLDDGGVTVAGPEGAVADGATLRLLLPTGLPAGRYLLTYRVTSIDAHPVAGSFAFGIGVTADPGGMAHVMGASVGWQIAVPVARLLATAGLLTALGLALFTGFVAERANDGLRIRLARRRRQAAAIGIGATVLGVGIQGGLLADLPLGALLGSEPWRVGFASTTGRSAALALLGAALLFPRTARIRTLVAAALIAGSFAATGHAAAAPPRWAAVAAVMLHMAGIAYWLGSLVGLEATLGFGPLRRITATVRRFTRLAIPVVAVLLLAGSVVAALQIRDPAALLANDYTRLLALKLAIVAVLLGFAVYNNRRLAPRLSRGDGTVAPLLRRSVRTEIACVALILVVTTLMARMPPPRATALQSADGPSIGVVTPRHGRLAFIELVRGGDGTFDLSASVMTANGQPIAADAVALRLGNAGAGIEPIGRGLSPRAAGVYADDADISLIPGRWQLRLDARVGDFDVYIFETEVLIR